MSLLSIDDTKPHDHPLISAAEIVINDNRVPLSKETIESNRSISDNSRRYSAEITITAMLREKEIKQIHDIIRCSTCSYISTSFKNDQYKSEISFSSTICHPMTGNPVYISYKEFRKFVIIVHNFIVNLLNDNKVNN